MTKVKAMMNIDTAEEFRKYVEMWESKGERHSEKAVALAGIIENKLESIDPTEPGGMSNLFDSVMSMAVEYEQSGFEAGMIWALHMTGSIHPCDDPYEDSCND